MRRWRDNNNKKAGSTKRHKRVSILGDDKTCMVRVAFRLNSAIKTQQNYLGKIGDCCE